MGTAAAVLTLAIVTLAGMPARAQPPELAARVDAYLDALASGSPDAFEAMATEHYTPELLARTAPQRRSMVERIHTDFGALTVAARNATGPSHVDVVMKSGINPMPMAIGFDFEPAAPFRIAGVAIRVGGPPGGRGGRGGPPPLAPPPINERMGAAEMTAALDPYLAGLAGAGNFSGVVLVAKEGRPIFEKAYGVADRERNTPMTADLRFNIASIGKAFTKTAIGQLIAAGRLKPSDTIGALLPDYPTPAARPATVDQLLHFRVGVADFFSDAFEKAAKERFRSNHDYYLLVAPQPLTFAPGERTEYCNGCFIVLGEIIEKVTGMPYERYVEEHVLATAGMKRTGFLGYGDAGVAPGYTRISPDAPWTSALALHGRHGSAAGGAFATAADLLAFDNALRTHVLLDAKTTAWYFGNPADETAARAADEVGIAGGSPGANASLESNGTWAIVALGNVDPPNAVRVGTALAGALYGQR